MSQERITQIEETLMHQAEQIDTLSQTVARQWDEIDMLKKLVKSLQGSVIEISDNMPAPAANQKPPHY